MADFFPKLICESSPRAYFSRIGEIYGGGNDVFLLNPRWTEEQKRVAENLSRRFRERGENASAHGGRIFIASGGSGGKIRFVAHTTETLEASARALCAMLRLPAGTPLNCFACLPPHHVSGLMPFVRSRVSGGKMFVADDGSFREDAALPEFRGSADEFWINSLVPTQLRRILRRKDGAAWLRGFDFILLGGGAVPADLIACAEAENLKIGIGYGMTETASLVALWRIGDGAEIAGTPLPHVKFFISGKNGGRIEVAAASLGETLADDGALLPNPGGRFLTNDEGRFDARGRLVVIGRADRFINSGGEKIDPALVEAALIGAGVPAALVVGEPDAEWGERVVALVAEPVPANLFSEAKKRVPAHMAPKRIIGVPALPFDEKGKLDRAALAALLAGGGERK